VSDLLGNLVSKALNLAPTIEPRPLSRFESWQATGALESTRLDSAVEVEAPSVAWPQPSSTGSLTMDQGREANDTPRQPIDRSRPDSIDPVRSSTVSERIERVSVERNQLERGDPDRSRRDLNVQPVVMPPAIAGKTPRVAEPPPTIIERIERLIVERSDQPQGEMRPDNDERLHQSMITVPNVDSDRVHAAPAIEAVGRPHIDRASDTPTVVVQSINTPPPLDASTDKRPLPPRPTPLVERLPAAAPVGHEVRSDDAAARPPAPPTIHVSIGRVEVRATLPPAPVKRSSSSTSTTSLDDYLRRRRAGDRR
jgi:hypothetical protein